MTCLISPQYMNFPIISFGNSADYNVYNSTKSWKYTHLVHIPFYRPLNEKKTWGVPFNAQKLSVPYTLYRVFIAGFIMSFWVFSQSFWVTTLNLNIVKIEITTQKQFFSELLFISVADPGRFFLDLDPDPDLQIRF